MTKEELKEEANKLGYSIIKKPNYQCSCYCPYPNINHKRANGWKCVDRYEQMEWERKHTHQPKTKCRRKDDKAGKD